MDQVLSDKQLICVVFQSIIWQWHYPGYICLWNQDFDAGLLSKQPRHCTVFSQLFSCCPFAGGLASRRHMVLEVHGSIASLHRRATWCKSGFICNYPLINCTVYWCAWRTNTFCFANTCWQASNFIQERGLGSGSTDKRLPEAHFSGPKLLLWPSLKKRWRWCFFWYSNIRWEK